MYLDPIPRRHQFEFPFREKCLFHSLNYRRRIGAPNRYNRSVRLHQLIDWNVCNGIISQHLVAASEKQMKFYWKATQLTAIIYFAFTAKKKVMILKIKSHDLVHQSVNWSHVLLMLKQNFNFYCKLPVLPVKLPRSSYIFIPPRWIDDN